MKLINLEDEIYYTIYEPEKQKFVMHTGTIKEFIEAFVETRYLKIYELNFLGYNSENALSSVGEAQHKEK